MQKLFININAVLSLVVGLMLVFWGLFGVGGAGKIQIGLVFIGVGIVLFIKKSLYSIGVLFFYSLYRLQNVIMQIVEENGGRALPFSYWLELLSWLILSLWSITSLVKIMGG